MNTIAKVFGWIVSHLAAAALALALAVAVVFYVRLQAAARAESKALRQALEAKAIELGGVVGENASQAKIIERMSLRERQFLAALKAAGKGKLDSLTKTKIELRDRIQFVERQGPEGLTWSDPHGRFSLALPSGAFDRCQAFEYRAVVIRSPDGRSRVAQESFQELEPATGKPITDETPAKLSTSFQFVEEKAEASRRGYLGLWPVAGLDVAARPLVGARVLDLERTGRPVLKDLGLGLLAGYDRKDAAGILGGFLGYRILGSNIEAVGYYGITTKGAPVAGAGIVFEISR